MSERTDTEKWVELTRLRRRVAALEDELGLESPPVYEGTTGNHAVDQAIQALVAEHASDVISVHGPNADIEYITPSVTRNFGYDPQALIGRNAYDLFHPDDIEAVAQKHAQLIDGQPRQVECRLRTADGTFRWVEVRGQALIVGSAMSRLVCITRDVHARRLAVEALERSNADLRHFALVAAHDLHEPLRTAAGFAELLARRYRDQLDARAQGYVDFIVDNVERMRRLIDDLLDYTRLEVQHPTFETVALGSLISEVLVELNEALTAAGAQIEVGPMPTVRGDRGQLAQLMRHLLHNAVKFRRVDVPLRVRVDGEAHAEGWLVQIADNGRGFGVADAERIFGMFERLVGPDVPGSGIGLAAAQRIVDRHGGRIWAEATPGQGATFFVRLPRAGAIEE